jgi:hypothetical protein
MAIQAGNVLHFTRNGPQVEQLEVVVTRIKVYRDKKLISNLNFILVFY